MPNVREQPDNRQGESQVYRVRTRQRGAGRDTYTYIAQEQISVRSWAIQLVAWKPEWRSPRSFRDCRDLRAPGPCVCKHPPYLVRLPILLQSLT